MLGTNQRPYAFRHERWVLTQLGRIFSGRMFALPRYTPSKQTKAMLDYLDGTGDIPFLQESKRTFSRQLLDHTGSLVVEVVTGRAFKHSA